MAHANDGPIVVITGAGNGIGRAHALAFAASGARVIVNDVGATKDGTGHDALAAETVAQQILEFGGEAIANTDTVATFDGAERLIGHAVETYGRIDVLVNNAGILRDRMLVNMTEAEWDAVLAVHLKGTFATVHHASKHWRERSKAGESVAASIVNTTSATGLFGQAGQANYGAAKAGIAALTLIAATELARYGVRVNAVAPEAFTRMTEDLLDPNEMAAKLAPETISPLVTYLASRRSEPITGRIFSVSGGLVTVLEGWTNGPSIASEAGWDIDTLASELPDALGRAAGNSDMRGIRQ